MAGASWRVVRKEKSLIAFPLLSAAFGIGYALLIMLPLGLIGFVVLGDSSIAGWVLLAIGLFGMNIGASFFGVAAAANASRRSRHLLHRPQWCGTSAVMIGLMHESVNASGTWSSTPR